MLGVPWTPAKAESRPLRPLTRNCIASTRFCCSFAERAGRSELARVRHDLRLLLAEAGELGAKLAELDVRSGQERVQLLAHLRGLGCGAGGGLHVALVLRPSGHRDSCSPRRRGRRRAGSRPRSGARGGGRTEAALRAAASASSAAWAEACLRVRCDSTVGGSSKKSNSMSGWGSGRSRSDMTAKMGAGERPESSIGPGFAGVCGRKAKRRGPWSTPSLSTTIISSSGDSDPCGRSAAEVRARSGS